MTIKPAMNGPDVWPAPDGTYEAYCDGKLVGPYPTAPEAWAAARHAATVIAPPEAVADGEMWRTRLSRDELDHGLSHEQIEYWYFDSEQNKIESYGVCEGFSLQLEHGEISIEIDTNLDFRRHVGIVRPTGIEDDRYRARAMVQLAELFRRDEVYNALMRWAAEDDAAEAVSAALAAQQLGGATS